MNRQCRRVLDAVPDYALYAGLWLTFYCLRRFLDVAAYPEERLFKEGELSAYAAVSFGAAALPQYWRAKCRGNPMLHTAALGLVLAVLATGAFVGVGRIGVITGVYAYLLGGAVAIDVFRHDLQRSCRQRSFVGPIPLWESLVFGYVGATVATTVFALLIIWTYDFGAFFARQLASIQCCTYGIMIGVLVLGRGYVFAKVGRGVHSARAPEVAVPVTGSANAGTPRLPRHRAPWGLDPGSVEDAFSSHTVLTRFPAPIAIAYGRFCRQENPRVRMDMLFLAAEATVRYLVILGLSDLFHCSAEADDERHAVLQQPAFGFLWTSIPMTFGKWRDALRAAAQALAEEPRRFVGELPLLSARGAGVTADLLDRVVTARNDIRHRPGSVPLSDTECRDLVGTVRPLLERLFQDIRYVCEYPLGFAIQRRKGNGDAPSRYAFHSCMGSRIADSASAYIADTEAVIRQEHPFVVSKGGGELLSLWPFLAQRHCLKTGRRTLYVFEGLPPNRRNMSQIRASAIDVVDEWRLAPFDTPSSSPQQLLRSMGSFLARTTLPADLRVAEALQGGAGGDLAGLTLGSNALVGAVARGGFGTVYLAVAKTGAPVAVKVLEARDSLSQFARFRQEFAKLKRAGAHPGIVQCFETGNDVIGGREYPWYSMEYAMGGDLSSRIEERGAGDATVKPWDSEEARTAVVQEFRAVLVAVAHLHALGIVHRDIKPGNVLIMEDGSLRLSDFGLVKELEPNDALASHEVVATSTGAVLGTRHYMAPEQQQGKEVDQSADVYSLGILLAELAAGAKPTANPRLTAGSTVSQSEELRSLPQPMRSLILACTDIDRTRRPQSAAEIRERFEDVVAAPLADSRGA